jgi:hypothetical protein
VSKVGRRYRSFLTIEKRDLRRLLKIATNDQEVFFATHPEWSKFYSRRVLCIALCQGAAKHYVDGKTGINDFDVYTFYKINPAKNWYAKRKKYYDLGNDKFGRSNDKPNFIGRRVDCLSRSIELRRNEDIVAALQRYLSEGKTKTARLLAQKAVVLLEPNIGQVIWP